MAGSNSLDRSQALALLKGCRRLAVRLDEQGSDIAINSPEDRQILREFEKVWQAGYLSDSTLPQEAELSPAHIAILGYLLAQEQSQS